MKKRIIVTAAITACLALCAAVCAFKGWGGVCTRQSPLKRVLRRLWAMCEKSVWIRLRRNRSTADASGSRETGAASGNRKERNGNAGN